MIQPSTKEKMHPRNRFRAGYDFARLRKESPTLAAFVVPNRFGDLSVDYADPRAVKALNQALLKQAYGLSHWDIPPGCLCPPVPGRSDSIHYLADLLREGGKGPIPRGPDISVLDIGMGANCIYPLIGVKEYGWRFVGSEVDPVALRWARRLVAREGLAELIECREQSRRDAWFEGIIRPGEFFDLTLCNPPFHPSAREAAASGMRKVRNLTRSKDARPASNFGGLAGELWCPGGERSFVQGLIRESLRFKEQCGWFTALVSRGSHLPALQGALGAAGVAESRVIEMAQGRKQSRILAWTFARR